MGTQNIAAYIAPRPGSLEDIANEIYSFSSHWEHSDFSSLDFQELVKKISCFLQDLQTFLGQYSGNIRIMLRQRKKLYI